MGKMFTNSLGESSELKLHWFCLFDAYSMPKDIYSVLTYEYIYSAIIIENMTQHFIQTDVYISHTVNYLY